MESFSIDKIQYYAKFSHIALVLFGSYSRGDFEDASDIDVLEVTTEKQKPYSSNKINFSTYTLEQLKQMATEGNLFVLHIIMEGQLLSGDKNVLSILENSFREPDNYEAFRNEILSTACLLDTDDTRFFQNPKGYYGLLCYLFRSYLYSKSYDEKDVCFSISQIAKKYGDPDIVKVFSLKYQKEITQQEFLFCKTLFEKYAGMKFENHLIDSVELLKALKESSTAGFSVAIHFLVDLAEEIYS